MARKILRSAVASVVDWFNSANGPKVDATPAAARPQANFSGVNVGAGVIVAGARVAVLGLYTANVAEAVAERRILNKKQRLAVKRADEVGATAALYATALTNAKPSHITRLALDGAWLAIVYGSGSYVTADGYCQADEDGAAGAVVDASTTASNKRVALVKSLGGDAAPSNIVTAVTGIAWQVSGNGLYITTDTTQFYAKPVE